MTPSEVRHLRAIRDREIDLAMTYLPPGARVLEIGAGAGYQAARMAERGFRVEAIDLASSEHRARAIFPITTYDGRRIPFADQSFEAVYSSSVLEHVEHPRKLLLEACRVLCPGGRAVHVLPTPAWRLWTSLTYHPSVAREAAKLVRRRGRGGATAEGKSLPAGSPLRLAFRVLVPAAHGARGNAATELVYFSRTRWLREFAAVGLHVEAVCSNALFYTGYSILGERLPLRLREGLSRVLGASCFVFVLRKPA